MTEHQQNSDSKAQATSAQNQKHSVASLSRPFTAVFDGLLEIFHAVLPNQVRVGRGRQPLSVALKEPWRAFDHPREVVLQRGLSSKEKHRMLDCWAEDAKALSVADDEGLNGGEPDRLADVMQAKGQLPKNGSREPN